MKPTTPSPSFDALLPFMRPNAARLYQIVWRYCQFSDGACRLPLRVLGHRLGLAASTTQRHLRILVRLGYLQETPPVRRRDPHAYTITEKRVPQAPRSAHYLEGELLDKPCP